MRKTFAAAAVAAGTTGALALGSAIPAHALAEPHDRYYYAAGTRQSGKPSQTSATEWEAFLGAGHIPPAHTVQYPRDLGPLVGTKTLDESVNEGKNKALELIYGYDDGGKVTLVGVSQGAVVMYRTKQALVADHTDGIDPNEISVLTYGDPVNPDGGLLSKFDRYNINIPGFTPATHTPGEGAYVTFAIEYDLIADAPDNLNPLSWANAAMGALYDHPSYSLDLVNQAGADGRVVSNTEQWYEVSDNGEVASQADAYYQHNLIKQTNLPITRPIRQIGTQIADDQGDVVVNRTVDQLDNLLRPIVDAGYDGGEPGGTRHVGTTTKHYVDEDGNPVPDPATADTAQTAPKTSTTNKPVRDATKSVSAAVKKLRDRLAPKAAEEN